MDSIAIANAWLMSDVIRYISIHWRPISPESVLQVTPDCPHFLFSMGTQRSACLAFPESSMHCMWLNHDMILPLVTAPFRRPHLSSDCCIGLEQSAGVGPVVSVVASFLQQTENRTFCLVLQSWLRTSHCADYFYVTSLFRLIVTCPCSLRT